MFNSRADGISQDEAELEAAFRILYLVCPSNPHSDKYTQKGRARYFTSQLYMDLHLVRLGLKDHTNSLSSVFELRKKSSLHLPATVPSSSFKL